MNKELIRTGLAGLAALLVSYGVCVSVWGQDDLRVADILMEKINDALSQGDCPRAKRAYNAWKTLAERTDSSIERRMEACGTAERKPTVSVASAVVGSITVTSDIAGIIMIDGETTGTRIKAGGTVTVSNVPTGSTEVAVKGDDGKLVKAPQKVMVTQGQTVSATVKASMQTDPPDDAKAFYDKGVVYSDKKDYDRAIADCEAALRIDPNYAKARNLLEIIRDARWKR